MNATLPQACDATRLEQLLEGQLSREQERLVLEHLEACPACRQALEQQAAGREAWEEAQRLLRPLSFPSREASVAGDNGWPDSTERTPAPIQAVLDTLAPTDDPQMLGRLGGYEVAGVVGAGGMGVVLKAIDKSLDRTVAIKVLAPHLAVSGAARRRFAREAKAAAAVLHPNVIAIHSVASDEPLPYLVMPYRRGTSLQKRLDEQGPLPVPEILRIGSQIAAGLAAAHAQGLVHRDIKPANILLDDGVERVTITDFGLARAVDDASITHTGVLAGTPQYMSPEQARDEPLDGRSDLFSLGSVLYAACTGRPPFRAETAYGVIRRISDDEPTSIRDINPEIPIWLATIISRLMAKRADQRYQSAAEVADLLAQCLAHVQQPTAARLPASLRAHAEVGRFSFIPRRRLGVIAMLTAFCLGLLGLFAWQTTKPPDIAGNWSGPDWGEVALRATGPGAYEGTYTDTFKEKPGTIEVRWSRLEGRYKGTWREGSDRSGKISLRLVDNEIRGAWTTSKKSEINPGTPELADLTWKRAAAPAEPLLGIRVQLLLNLESHSREMLRENIGFDQLSIMGSGLTGTVNGKTHDNLVAVLAHRCRLESFEEAEHAGTNERPSTKCWKATLFVPQDPTSDGSNRDLSQNRLDELQKQGVKFSLDHHRTQSVAPRAPAMPVTKQPGARIAVLTPQQVEENGAKLYHSRERIAVQFKVLSAKPIVVTDEKGTQHQQYDLYGEGASKFSVRVTDQAIEALKSREVADIGKCFVGKWIRVEGAVYGVGLDLISQPETLWTYHLDLNSLDQLSEVEPAPPEARQPNLQGTVTDVTDRGLVEISLGAVDGLRAGDELIVFRDKSYLGKITVQKAAEDKSVARVNSRQGDIRRGDRVSTAPEPNVPSPPSGPVQLRLTAPAKMVVAVADEGGRFDKSSPFVVPARLNLAAGQTHRLKITNIAGYDGLELHPTAEIGQATPRTEAFLAHNAIPLEFTAEDFDQVLAGNLVTKVIYLPNLEFQEVALAGVETLVSTRLETGTDPIAEAKRRGSILAVVRLGNKDPEARDMPTRLHQFAVPFPVERLACSPDGKLIAVTNGNPTFILQTTNTSRLADDWKPRVEVLDGQSGKSLASLKLSTAEEDAVLAATERVFHFEVTGLAFSPDAQVLAIGTSIGQVKLFRAQTGELVRTLDDRAARLADKATPDAWQPMQRAHGSVRSLAFSPDGRLLATCGESFADYSDVFDGIESLGLPVSGPGRLKVWDVSSGALNHDLPGHSQAFGVAFSGEGSLLASAGRWTGSSDDGNGVLVWHAQTGEKTLAMLIEANAGTHKIGFAPGRKLAAIGSIQFDKENATSATSIAMAFPQSGLTEWQRSIDGWAVPAWLPDGNHLAVLCGGKFILVIDAQTGQTRHEVKVAEVPEARKWNDLAAVAAPEGARLVIGGRSADKSGLVEVWTVGTAQSPRTSPAAGQGAQPTKH